MIPKPEPVFGTLDSYDGFEWCSGDPGSGGEPGIYYDSFENFRETAADNSSRIVIKMLDSIGKETIDVTESKEHECIRL